MTELEQKILDTIQDAFPLEERPYRVLADLFNAQVGSVTEQQVFDAVEGLRMSGVIRRIGGVYDSKALGFISRLCAGKVPTVVTGAADDSALEVFAATVNEIPAITHNYVRSHEYNVWPDPKKKFRSLSKTFVLKRNCTTFIYFLQPRSSRSTR